MRLPMRRSPNFQPFASRGRRAVAGILCTFALSSALTVGLSIWSTSRSRNQAAVVEVAGRQRTLAERYVEQILLVRGGERADPGVIARDLRASARALLDGGTAPAVAGDDDGIVLPAAHDRIARAQLEQARRLANDLTTTGEAILAGRPVSGIPLTAGEHLRTREPLRRLRVLAALESNMSLNATRTIANAADRNISDLIVLEIGLGAGGLLLSLLLAWALIATTRRQTAHFRSVVDSSTDLVIVFGPSGCRYVSPSVTRMVGCSESDLLGEGVFAILHVDDRTAVRAAARLGEPHELVFRMIDPAGAWRQLEAHVSDLRYDRQVRGVVFNARDVTERMRLAEQLARQAFHDSLTDLPNRALFRDRLDHSLARCMRSAEPLTVMLVDLDGFKQVNDSLGHDAGDELLKEVAQRFAESVRASDTVARFGGDEFAVLLEGADERQTLATADRLLEKLRAPVTVAGRELVLTASIGVVMRGGGSSTGEDLIRDADIAMYAAKEGGRARHEVFHDEMARELGELLGIEHELRVGLERGEFGLHYQPMVDLASDRVIGVEALLRWHSPSRGEVAPGRFIPVAESTGLIVELGEFVLLEGCRQAARWRADEAIENDFVTWINVSPRQLAPGGFGARVLEALARTGLPASSLGLEITESAIVEPGSAGDHARRELEELHALGLRIAIDDFGTGFSSLGQLRHFPIDMIKVDRSFVQGTERDTKDATITSNLISLAHALNVTAVAEGIESTGQLESLRQFGCDSAQGFLFAHPAPAAEIYKVLLGPGVGEPPSTAVA
jgi:diguanylate cyclase (GGDEF)-like protein/PAS domain S-box-containing protein